MRVKVYLTKLVVKRIDLFVREQSLETLLILSFSCFFLLFIAAVLIHGLFARMMTLAEGLVRVMAAVEWTHLSGCFGRLVRLANGIIHTRSQ